MIKILKKNFNSSEMRFTNSLGTARLTTILLVQFKALEPDDFSHFSILDLERISTPSAL